MTWWSFSVPHCYNCSKADMCQAGLKTWKKASLLFLTVFNSINQTPAVGEYNHEKGRKSNLVFIWLTFYASFVDYDKKKSNSVPCLS